MTLVGCLVIGTTVNVMAESRRETITVSANQVWNVRSAITRTRNYSSVYARCYSVYPTNGGEDNYTRVQVVVKNSDGKNISDIVTLYETASTSEEFRIKEGYLSTKKIKFAFRGNNPKYGARADVSYNGR